MFDFKYIAVFPKIMAWRSSLLKDSEIEAALNMDLNELKDMVKSRLKKVKLTSDDITSLEKAVKQEGFLFIKSVERFVHGSSKKFFKIWLKLYEVENIKLMLKILLLGRKDFFHLLFELEPGSKFQAEFLRNINTIDEFLDFMSGTEYYSIAKDTFPRVNETKTTFFFDIAIDNYMVAMLKRFYDSLSPFEKSGIEKLFFYFIESKRIVSLYRARFLFNLGKNECMVLLPELLGLISSPRYEMLLEAENEEKFIKLLVEWKLISPKGSEENYEDYIEYYFFKELRRRAKNGMKKGGFSISFFLSFFILHYLNEKNWIALLESKKEGINIEDTMKFLIL